MSDPLAVPEGLVLPWAAPDGAAAPRPRPTDERIGIGRARRRAVPRAAHGDWRPGATRPDPVALLVAGNAGRDPGLVPLRMGRMARSPFAFLRGAAAVMAADLATTAASGIPVFVDGDAHLANFGLFGTADAQVVVDLNDFDEVLVGPWEWDVKRLTASLEVAGREIGLAPAERAHAVRGASAGYRGEIRALASLPVLALWQRRTAVADLFAGVPPAWSPADGVATLLERARAKAAQSGHAALLARTAVRDDATGWRFAPQPPVLTALDEAERHAVAAGLSGYLGSLSPERRYLMQRYRLADVAHRVVGVGSVGLRAYCVLLFGHDDDDPLLLQVKQAAPPAHAPFAAPLPAELSHDGRRVVYGQRLMQAFGDPLLGWTTIEGRPFYVRQMRNLKASFAPERMSPPMFAAFAWAYGTLLARAHARTGDAAAIGGYCGAGGELDDALVGWAVAYADRTEADHAALCAAIARGEVEALAEPAQA